MPKKSIKQTVKGTFSGIMFMLKKAKEQCIKNHIANRTKTNTDHAEEKTKKINTQQ